MLAALACKTCITLQQIMPEGEYGSPYKAGVPRIGSSLKDSLKKKFESIQGENLLLGCCNDSLASGEANPAQPFVSVFAFAGVFDVDQMG